MKAPMTAITTIRALTLAALVLAGTQASAQRVVLYGLIDNAVEHIDNVGPAGYSVTRMPSTSASLPSRWGMRGSEDLGAGLSAVFTLESGFGADTGASGQAGRLFGRQAFVGLSGNWGTVGLGRQYTMLTWALGDADLIGPMVFGLGSLDNYLPNARADNAITYRAKFDGLSVGAGYSVGRDSANPTPNNPSGTNCGGEVAGDRKACREWSALLKYDQTGWGVAAAIDRQQGGTGAWAASGLTSSALSDTRAMLNGYARFASAKLAGGLIHRTNQGTPGRPRSDLWFAGVNYPVTQLFHVDVQLARLKFDASPDKALLGVVRGTYNLSRKTAVYAAVGRIDNDAGLALSVSSGAGGSNPVAGGSQTGVVAGLRVAF